MVRIVACIDEVETQLLDIMSAEMQNVRPLCSAA